MGVGKRYGETGSESCYSCLRQRSLSCCCSSLVVVVRGIKGFVLCAPTHTLIRKTTTSCMLDVCTNHDVTSQLVRVFPTETTFESVANAKRRGGARRDYSSTTSRRLLNAVQAPPVLTIKLQNPDKNPVPFTHTHIPQTDVFTTCREKSTKIYGYINPNLARLNSRILAL